jgi:hypothetical protein
MVSTLGELELQSIDLMSRQQVLDAIGPRQDCLPPDLREHLEEQPTGRLRLLLMAARLIQVLRLTQSADRAGNAPRG